MPNIQSKKKSLRQSLRRRARNRFYWLPIRRLNRSILSAVEKGDKEKAASLYHAYVCRVDKAVGKGALKKGWANRKKSRIIRKINQMGSTEPKNSSQEKLSTE